MFSVYLDDSGTDPKQHVAMATAIIIPGRQLIPMESEWNSLTLKEGFSSLHTSEMIAANPKSEFASWEDKKQARVFRRSIEISKKYSTLLGAVSFAVKKVDYDELVPEVYRNGAGNHYTWAVRHLLMFLDSWRLASASTDYPLEYIFDWMGGPSDSRRIEVEDVMSQMEAMAHLRERSGEYTNYSFSRRQDAPGLQCVDVISWICYRQALFQYRGVPLHSLAEEGWKHCEANTGRRAWLQVFQINRQHLKEGIDAEMKDGTTLRRTEEWRKTGKISS
jgi:hypothetical protein